MVPDKTPGLVKMSEKRMALQELGAEREDLQGEDIDNRTYGELLHNVHHDIIAETLGFEMGLEREHETDFEHISVQRSGLDQDEIMRKALESLDSRAHGWREPMPYRPNDSDLLPGWIGKNGQVGWQIQNQFPQR